MIVIDNEAEVNAEYQTERQVRGKGHLCLYQVQFQSQKVARTGVPVYENSISIELYNRKYLGD